MINLDFNLVFVHVIKTGGVSISTAFDMEETQCHLPASRVRALIGEDLWGQCFKFSFIRNPFDKIVSQFFYNSQKFGFKKDASFNEYVKAWDSGVKISVHPQLNSDYIDEDLDFIGRFENLQEDFDFICGKLNINRRTLPHKNKSNHEHYTKYHDEETKSIISKKFAIDLERFNYKFGE
tara:strand:- start:805 stop:1341 length:537 start_codon:yes stop_codon:yes gene_type:complete